MTQLYPQKFTHEDAEALAPIMRQADIRDLIVHQSSPRDALLQVFNEGGEAWSVHSGRGIIGAGGWTQRGIVWSLWADLTFEESKALMRTVVPWARIIAIRAKRPLSNVFVKGNHQTEHFLLATRCVTTFPQAEILHEGRTYIPFMLKPIEDMPHV